MAATNTQLVAQLRRESIRHDQELLAGRFPTIEVRHLLLMDKIFGETVEWNAHLMTPHELIAARATALAFAAEILAWRTLGWK